MEVYLDNSATTKAYDEVVALMEKVMREDYGNPSSMHMKGVEAERYVTAARKSIASILGCKEKEVFFTAGGTESDNWALIGVARAMMRSGKHIITTRIEHPAVLNTCAYLESEGFEVTYLDTDETGTVRLSELEEAIREDTILVSVMYVNNEVGSIQPIEEIGKIVKEKGTKACFHVDAVQGFGKLKLTPKKWNVDMISVSGHKIHGPKGVGFLYIDEKVKIKPYIFGGGQQNGYRSGTENVPGIAGLGKASEMIYASLKEDSERLYRLKELFAEGLLRIEGVTVNGPAVFSGAPHIVSASFDGVRSEVLLHALEEKGIYVSAGSACSSHKRKMSDTLQAMGFDEAKAETTVRFSMSVFTTEEEIAYTVQCLSELLPMLRRFRRK
ncbi:MAG: cysteine desulfurase [Lachnospiraceae bacterium]|nr:cysteine desulfurase [Lachnospiraceae bacterium]